MTNSEKQEIISSIISINSEAFASEFIEIIEEMFIL